MTIKDLLNEQGRINDIIKGKKEAAPVGITKKPARKPRVKKNESTKARKP